MAETLQELYKAMKDCQKCALGKTRTKLVFGVGSENADLMFVGEAPGYYEDQQGEPFVGAAGQLLDRLLASIDLSRDQIYIANVLKCRPPQNRDPLPEEVEICQPYLFEQIKIIKPVVVCALGRHAAQLLLNKNVSMTKVHGKRFEGQGCYVFPIYHPAAALYARTTLTALEEDFLKLSDLLKVGLEPPPRQIEETQQMGLF